MVKNPTAIPAEVAAYGGTGRADLSSKRGGPRRRIDTLRTLAIGSALILAIGTTACANEEDTSDTGELVSVEASPPAEATEEEADETSEPASVAAPPPAEATEEATDEMSPSAEKPDTEASEAEEE